MTMQTALLKVHELSVEYAVRGGRLKAVDGVSLELARGDIMAVVGESGCGKTTLAQAILRLRPACAGRVELRGEDLLTLQGPQLRRARREIQAVFQDPFASLSPRRTVLQTLSEPLRHFRLAERGACAGRAADALSAVGLETSLLHRFPHELSGGQRQRVALARALVTEPALIVADEPLSSLDVPVRARIIRLIRKLRDEHGIAFLVVSHDLSVVRQLADRVAVMYLGRVVEIGPAASIFTAPAHPYTRALLRAIPVADPAAPPPRVLEGEPPSPLTPPAGCVFHKRCSEAMPCCRQDRPEDRDISARQGRLEGHRVRCRLWDS